MLFKFGVINEEELEKRVKPQEPVAENAEDAMDDEPHERWETEQWREQGLCCFCGGMLDRFSGACKACGKTSNFCSDCGKLYDGAWLGCPRCRARSETE